MRRLHEQCMNVPGKINGKDDTTIYSEVRSCSVIIIAYNTLIRHYI